MTTSSEVSSDTATPITSSTASPRESPMGSAESATAAEGAGSLLDRKRIEEQLAQLERKRLELSRALVIADHPELADPIRLVEGRLYAVGRVEERMREGLSKAEARKVETLGKKRQALLAKKAELDLKRAELEAEVAGLDRELAALGEEREQAFVRERAEALEALVVTLAKVGPAFDAAAVEPTSLVPDLAARMDEIRATAQALAAGSVAPS